MSYCCFERPSPRCGRDAKSIRRVTKVAIAKEEEDGGDGTATAKPSGTEAMANGGTETCVGAINDDCLDLSDDDSSSSSDE